MNISIVWGEIAPIAVTVAEAANGATSALHLLSGWAFSTQLFPYFKVKQSESFFLYVHGFIISLFTACKSDYFSPKQGKGGRRWSGIRNHREAYVQFLFKPETSRLIRGKANWGQVENWMATSQLYALKRFLRLVRASTHLPNGLAARFQPALCLGFLFRRNRLAFPTGCNANFNYQVAAACCRERGAAKRHPRN